MAKGFILQKGTAVLKVYKIKTKSGARQRYLLSLLSSKSVLKVLASPITKKKEIYFIHIRKK